MSNQISAQEQHMLQQGIQAVAAHLQQKIAGGADSVSVIRFVHRQLDQIADAPGPQGMTLACAVGCDHCCRQLKQIEISEAEADLMLSVFTDAAQQQALLQRLQQSEANAAHQPCVMLEQGRCSVYAVRPGVCRKAHSYDAAACAALSEDVPQNLERVLRSEAMLLGLRAVLTPAQSRVAPVNQALLAAAARAGWFSADASQS